VAPCDRDTQKSTTNVPSQLINAVQYELWVVLIVENTAHVWQKRVWLRASWKTGRAS